MRSGVEDDPRSGTGFVACGSFLRVLGPAARIRQLANFPNRPYDCCVLCREAIRYASGTHDGTCPAMVCTSGRRKALHVRQLSRPLGCSLGLCLSIFWTQVYDESRSTAQWRDNVPRGVWTGASTLWSESDASSSGRKLHRRSCRPTADPLCSICGHSQGNQFSRPARRKTSHDVRGFLGDSDEAFRFCRRRLMLR